MPLEELLTAAEVAKRLRISSASVYIWAEEGKLPVVRLPTGRLRFRSSDIEAIINPPAEVN